MTLTHETNSGQLASRAVPRPIVASSPTRLDNPSFLLNCPFSFSTEDANNAWMQELSDDERRIDRRQALRQFLELYHFVSSQSVVYLLPAPAGCGLQDLVFTANLGIVLEHLADRNVVVLANFSARARRGETEIGRHFFEGLGYEVHTPATRFEGEAELKHLHGSVYIGGHGLRSELETYRWMEREFGMRVIPVKETDPYLYHLDTMVFPVTREKTLVCTEAFEPAEVQEIEKHTEIIDVALDDCYSGICNSVRIYNTILNASNIHDLKAGTEDYRLEVAKNRRLEDIASELGFEVAYFNLSEFLKGGALLSCMAMHLNRRSYDIRLL